MSKHAKINLALAVIIIILLLVSTSVDKEPVIKKVRVSDIDPGSISEITVSRLDKADLVFKKVDDSWQMQSPLQVQANTARINAMLRLLNSESHNQLNPEEVELARFELDTPAVSLQLNDHVFQLGNTDGIDQRRYVLFAGTIHMVNDFLYAQLVSNPGFFADPRLVAEGKNITAIAFPENVFTLVDGEWQMQTLMDIKPDQLKQLAYSWENALALSVSSYEQPAQDFPISITTSDNETLVFDIVSTEPHLVLGRQDLGIQYHMGSDEAQKLLLQENTATATETPSPG